MSGSYKVYKRLTQTGDDTLVDTIPAGTETKLVTGDPNSVAWYHVKAWNEKDKADAEPVRLKRVAFDASGNLILPVPNAPSDLQLTLTVNGGVTAKWRYSKLNQAVAPSTFNIYIAEDDAAFDFNTPDFQVTYTASRLFSQALGTFANFTLVNVIVRAESSTGAEDDNHAVMLKRADTQAPDAPTLIFAEVTDE